MSRMILPMPKQAISDSDHSPADLVHVGQRLRAIRLVAGLKQEPLCELLGVDQSTYSKWERGKRVPDVRIMTIFARRLRTSLDFIFLGELGDMHPELTRMLNDDYPELMAGLHDRTAPDKDTARTLYRAAIGSQRLAG